MSDDSHEASEFSATARRVYASLVEGLNLRFELFSLELGEERKRVVEVIVACLALVFSVFMLLLCVNAALLILFWESHRLLVVFGSIGFYAALLAGCVLFLRSRSGAQAEPFEATREVLEQDRKAWID